MRGHLCDLLGHRFRFLVAAAALVVLLIPSPASAAPPANDNRVAAQAIESFPATIEGTTIEATVERLDPQVSQCGSIESTVWYRIDKAPDGTVAIGVSGVGFAPVVRVYDVGKSGIDENTCATAKAAGVAKVSFRTTRGNTYLVLVGKKPSTRDGAFTLTAGLYLPPPNDSRSQAKKLGPLPASAKGTTLGAGTDENDPEGCRLSEGTVWYSLAPKAERMIVKIRALGGLDASLAVVEKSRSETNVVGCVATNARGTGVVSIPVAKKAKYFIVVGQRAQSPHGEFVLDVVRAQARERAPGKALATRGVRGTLNGLTDVNDVYWIAMSPGRTFKVALTSKPCVALTLRRRGVTLGSMSCSGYGVFTPGPDGGGRYILEVVTEGGTGSAAYQLRVSPAGADDVGLGSEIRSLSVTHGSLAPAAADLVDLYHFDVQERSDVRLTLAGASTASLILMTDSGQRLGSQGPVLRRQLERGRYVAAVRSTVGAPASKYVLRLVIRRITATTLQVSAKEISPGAAVTLTTATAPNPGGGLAKLQVDRFDPLSGWQFHHIVTLPLRSGGSTVTWAPPALGRWRVRASFAGTTTFSPSRSGYAYVLVATPIALAT